MEDIRGILREFIVDNFLFGDAEGLNDQTSFLNSGIVDSTGILEIVNFIGETFLVTVADEDLVPENLDSIDKLVNYLSTRQQFVGKSQLEN